MKKIAFVICIMILGSGCAKIPQSEYRYIDTKEMR